MKIGARPGLGVHLRLAFRGVEIGVAEGEQRRIRCYSRGLDRRRGVAEVGVRAGDRVLAGAPLIKLATVDPMVVDVDVPPSIVNTLHRGDAAVIRVLGSTDEHHGRILTIAPLPGAAGAHTLEVEFGNPSRTLLAGQTARVRFAAGR